MEDELDQLLESIVSFDDDVPDPANDDSTPDPSAAIEEEAELEVQPEADSTTDDNEEGSQEAELPDSDPDGTTPPPAPDPEVEQLRRSNQAQAEFIRNVIENARAEKEATAAREKEEKDNQTYQALLDKWDRMDPDEARNEQVRYMAERADERQKALTSEIDQLRNQLASSAQERAAQENAALEEAARAEVLTTLTKQYSLTDAEVEDLADYADPWVMEKYAQRAQSRRQGQTAAAREAKRQQIESNPALRTGDIGNGAPPPPKKQAESVDELVDNLFASLGF